MTYKARHATEAAVAWLLYIVFALLPLDLASAFGGWIGRTFGPSLRVSNNARRNLRFAYPDRSDEQIEIIVRGMWDNLGRTAGDFGSEAGSARELLGSNAVVCQCTLCQ